MPRITRRRFIAGAAALGVVRPALAAPYTEGVAAGISQAERNTIRQLADTFLSAFGAPGLSVAYAKGGTLVYSAAFGHSDLALSKALKPSNLFRVASISKPITASAIMQLVEGGVLKLDSKVFGKGGVLNKHYPTTTTASNKNWLHAITVDHLLSHTCGGWSSSFGYDPMFADPALSLDNLIRDTLANVALSVTPGTVYAYSNFGYCLLGRIVKAVTGSSYPLYVRQRILKPSGAEDMKIAGNTIAERHPGEVFYKGQGGENPYSMNVARMDAHGGWIATATDLVNIGLRIDGYGTVKDLISKSSVTQMRTPTSTLDSYGRGWQISTFHKNRWHTGSLPGTTTILALVDGGNCFAGLVNSRSSVPDSGWGLDKLMWDIYAQVIN